ncbi:hypothetical protein LguiA_035856 [Lonicera macranthoides]
MKRPLFYGFLSWLNRRLDEMASLFCYKLIYCSFCSQMIEKECIQQLLAELALSKC